MYKTRYLWLIIVVGLAIFVVVARFRGVREIDPGVATPVFDSRPVAAIEAPIFAAFVDKVGLPLILAILAAILTPMVIKKLSGKNGIDKKQFNFSLGNEESVHSELQKEDVKPKRRESQSSLSRKRKKRIDE